MYYVYAYLDPRKPGTYRYKTDFGWATFDHEPYYIGKGIRNRYTVHVEMAVKKQRRGLKYSKIRKILRSGHELLIKKSKCTFAEVDSFLCEQQLIRVIGRFDLGTGPLTNLTDGGEGAWNSKQSDKKRKACAEAARNQAAAMTKAARKRRAVIANAAAQLVTRDAEAHKEGIRRSWAKRHQTPEEREAYRLKYKSALLATIAAYPTVTCPHCGLTARQSSNMKRWHFDKCKHRVAA
jgi:hypothetical protein